MNKRTRIVLIALIIAVTMIPSYSYARDFQLNDNKITISFDTNTWMVFTKDNIEKNKDELKKLGTTPKAMKSAMVKSNAHLVAIKNMQENREEILVRIKHNEYINNISTMSESDMKALKKGLTETYSNEIKNLESKVFRTDNVTWIKMTGNYDEKHLVIQYFTIVNGEEYLIAAQKVTDYTNEDKEELDKLVSTTMFIVDDMMVDNDLESYIKKQEEALSESENGKTKIFAGIAIIFAVAAVLYLKNRKYRKKKEC